MKVLWLSIAAWLFFTLSVSHVCAQAEKVFFGNLHSHTSYSNGSGTPDEAYHHAREVAHLDFLAITSITTPSAKREQGTGRMAS